MTDLRAGLTAGDSWTFRTGVPCLCHLNKQLIRPILLFLLLNIPNDRVVWKLRRQRAENPITARIKVPTSDD
jgi:hypothetical protein